MIVGSFGTWQEGVFVCFFAGFDVFVVGFFVCLVKLQKC